MIRVYEEVLEALWTADERGEHGLEQVKKACTVAITDQLLADMQQENLIAYDRENLYFTAPGKELATRILRRHRLAEVLLTQVLKIREGQMDRIACEFEHYVQPEVEESICTLLGHPSACPHGLPIPPGPCCRERRQEIARKVVSLDQLDVGEKAKVAYIKPRDHDRLQRLASFGIVPGALLELHQKRPAYVIRLEEAEIAMDCEIGGEIFVWKMD